MALIRSDNRRLDLRSPTSFTQADLLGLVGKGLRNVYGAADEPLPDDLSEIVERLKQQERVLASKANDRSLTLRSVPFQARPSLRAA